MASKFKEFIEDVPGGWVVGIGAIVLAPIVAPIVVKAGKPLAKAAIKRGLRLYKQSKGAIAEAGEVFEDLVAEAQAELADERREELSAELSANFSSGVEPAAEVNES